MSERRKIMATAGGKRFRIVCADRHQPRPLGTIVHDRLSTPERVYVEDVELARTPADRGALIGAVVSRGVRSTRRERSDGGVSHVFECRTCGRLTRPVAVRSENLPALVAMLDLAAAGGLITVHAATGERHVPLQSLRTVMSALRSR